MEQLELLFRWSPAAQAWILSRRLGLRVGVEHSIRQARGRVDFGSFSRFTTAVLLSAGGDVLFATISLGCTRCHFVSGKKKTNSMNTTANIATLSHQKLRQLEWYVMGPAMIGPTWRSQTGAGRGEGETYHE